MKQEQQKEEPAKDGNPTQAVSDIKEEVRKNVHLRHVHGQIEYRLLKRMKSTKDGDDSLRTLKSIHRDVVIDLISIYKIAIQTIDNPLPGSSSASDNSSLEAVPFRLLRKHKPYGIREKEWMDELVDWLSQCIRMNDPTSLSSLLALRSSLVSVFPTDQESLHRHFKLDLMGQEKKLKQVLELTRGVSIFRAYVKREELPSFIAQSSDTRDISIKDTIKKCCLELEDKIKKGSSVEGKGGDASVRTNEAFPLFQQISRTYLKGEYAYFLSLLSSILYNIEHSTNDEEFVVKSEPVSSRDGTFRRDGNSIEIQTDVHPPSLPMSKAYEAWDKKEKTKVDSSSYEWSEWKMRADALLMVKRDNGKESSAQCKDSAFRRDGQVQTYVHGKTSYAQTRTDSSVSPPRLIRAPLTNHVYSHHL